MAAKQRHGLIYHWKHGWIPLTHAAALSKAHGSAKGADRYVAGTSAHHASRPTRGMSARSLHGGLEEHRHAPSAPSTPSPEHFRMGGEELRRRAAQGDTKAQAELDRRAARRSAGGKAGGRRQGVPFAPKPESKPEPPKAAPPKPPEPPKAPERKPEPPKAPEPPKPPSTMAERDREAVIRAEQENNRILDRARFGTFAERNAMEGHTISSRVYTHRMDLSPALIHTHRNAKGERIGSVVDWNGGYRANFDAGKRSENLGQFTDRAEAHRVLAERHKSFAEAERVKAEKAAAARERKFKKMEPVGVWQPHQFESDGTRIGDAAAKKIKQAYRFGPHKVHIEAALNAAQTKALLDDIHSVLLKSDLADANGKDAPGITFYVPTGDSHFRAKPTGIVGGYVRMGTPTVHINPRIANGEIEAHFGGPTFSDPRGLFMPAARQAGSGRQYVIAHEMGHVLDGHHQHTDGGPSTRLSFPTAEASKLARSHREHLSKYGNSNAYESYAEAYAQWVHGGPGSNPAADAFAAKYGWKVPKWARLGRARE